MKFVRVTRLAPGKFSEEPLDVLGWVGEHMKTMTPAGPDQMDCYCLDDGKLWPIDESDQEAARKAQQERIGRGAMQ